MAELIPSPSLDVRSVEQIAAQGIGFTCGPLTVERIDFQIGVQRELRALVEGGALPPPVCAELTSANPCTIPVTLIEVMAWLVGIIARRINRLPYKVQVEFARLFRIELREATRAEVELRFTVAPPPGQGVTIPEGTTVRSDDGLYTFQTVEDLVLAAGVAVGTVGAVRDVAGSTTLAPGVLTGLYDPVAWVSSVTNLEAVESGADAESIESALSRARNYQRRGERLVTDKDFEDALLEDALLGGGIVKAFDKVKDGDWVNPDGSLKIQAGHMTVVVMTTAGGAVSAATKQTIAALLAQRLGNIFVSVRDPEFVDFQITATLRLAGLTPQDAILAAVRQKLQDFYAATSGNFGKSIYQSDIIGIIEGSAGVERIERQPGGELLAAPAADLPVAPYEMPRLTEVTLNVI